MPHMKYRLYCFMPELKLPIESSLEFLVASQLALLSTGGLYRKRNSKHRALKLYFETRDAQNFPVVHLGALFWIHFRWNVL